MAEAGDVPLTFGPPGGHAVCQESDRAADPTRSLPASPMTRSRPRIAGLFAADPNPGPPCGPLRVVLPLASADCCPNAIMSHVCPHRHRTRAQGEAVGGLRQ